MAVPTSTSISSARLKRGCRPKPQSTSSNGARFPIRYHEVKAPRKRHPCHGLTAHGLLNRDHRPVPLPGQVHRPEHPVRCRRQHVRAHAMGLERLRDADPITGCPIAQQHLGDDRMAGTAEPELLSYRTAALPLYGPKRPSRGALQILAHRGLGDRDALVRDLPFEARDKSWVERNGQGGVQLVRAVQRSHAASALTSRGRLETSCSNSGEAAAGAAEGRRRS